MLIARVAIDYLNEGHLVPTLHVRTRVMHIGRTSMTEHQGAWQNNTCLALAEVVFAYRENGQAAEWPQDLRELLLTMKV